MDSKRNTVFKEVIRNIKIGEWRQYCTFLAAKIKNQIISKVKRMLDTDVLEKYEGKKV